jgi:hypothetical protein
MDRGVTKEECGLHPLIHTLLKLNLAQDIDWCQGGKKKTPTNQVRMVGGGLL